MHIGGGADHRMDQARGRVHSDMATHPEKPLVPLGHRVHLRVPFTLLVLGGTGGVDDRGIEDRPFLQQGALILESLLDRLENLLADAVLLEQMTKIQNRGLIWNPLRNHVDARKAPETGGVDQHLLHQRV